jgi:hypothetical protein
MLASTIYSAIADGVTPPGQRSQNPPDVLQGQGLQEAHPAQGHPVQGWQGQIPIAVFSSVDSILMTML